MLCYIWMNVCTLALPLLLCDRSTWTKSAARLRERKRPREYWGELIGPGDRSEKDGRPGATGSSHNYNYSSVAIQGSMLSSRQSDMLAVHRPVNPLHTMYPRDRGR